MKSSFCHLTGGLEIALRYNALGPLVIHWPIAGTHCRRFDGGMAHDTSAYPGAHFAPLVHNVHLPGSQQVSHRRDRLLLAVCI